MKALKRAVEENQVYVTQLLNGIVISRYTFKPDDSLKAQWCLTHDNRWLRIEEDGKIPPECIHVIPDDLP